jgi:acyl-CoA thioester hydrolase
MTEISGTATSGRFEGTTHIYPVRVHYHHTDASGIVYHANYLHFGDAARTELMRLCGMDHARLISDLGVAFAVRRCNIDYEAASRLDDALEVVSKITNIRGASMEIEQTIRSAETADRPDRARILLTLFCINQSGRPVRLPGPVLAALRTLSTLDPNP